MENQESQMQNSENKSMASSNRMKQLSRILSAKRKAKMKLTSIQQSKKPTNLSEKPLEKIKREEKVKSALKERIDGGLTLDAIKKEAKEAFGEDYDEKELDDGFNAIARERVNNQPEPINENETANTTTPTATRTAKNEIMKNIKWIALGIFLILLVLNPSPSEFKKHIISKTGRTPAIAYRKANFLIFSIYFFAENSRYYGDGNGTYVGVLQNFIEI